ncbi:MAG TPA: cyclase family protein [Mycobacteriales bacterium]|jgi:kynurenine formamidase|nr:cyclase family protein [Mycobacteriales bacterium]
MTEYRANFDASITFGNGGGLQAQGFRLDVPGSSVTAEEVGALLVRHLGLLMVDRVDISGLTIIAEPHKGSRGVSDVRPTGQRLVELNHVITAGMTTYPGLPGPEIMPHLTREASQAVYAPGTEFTIDRISMLGNTGTYLDAPFHRYADGADLAGLPLASVADLPIVLVRLTGSTDRGIDATALQSLDVAGRAVLLHTGWDEHWGTPGYGDPAPFVTAAAARWLVDSGAVLVGIDSVNIDDSADGTRPAHSILLKAGVPVLEHLTALADVPVEGARLHAAAPRITGFGTFPVRAYAVLS